MIGEAVARLRGKRVHIVGLSGTEGSTVAEFLLDHGISSITAHDLQTRDAFPAAFGRYHAWMDAARQEAAIRRLLEAPIAIRFRDRYLEGIGEADVIYAGQAWFRHPENEPVARARDAGVPLSSMTELFFQTVPCPILGVTGTNGKFTVVHLAGEMLAHSGRQTFVSGNDRTHIPILYRLAEMSPEAVLVLEISNRQLVGLNYSPQIAVITNLAPHHLDDHGTFQAYVEVKAGILAHQEPQGVAVLNADDPVVWPLAARAHGRVLAFSRTRRVDEGACVIGGRIAVRLDGREEQVCGLDEILVPGGHTVENALAAAASARAAGAEPRAIARALRGFRGLPYRMWFVDEIGGVRYYEDSLATNPAAAAAGIRAFDRPLVLIAGGHRRGGRAEDFVPMTEALAGRRVRAVLLIGAMAPEIQAAIAARGLAIPVQCCGTLPAAVRAAAAAAEPGDAVNLSPGCESFDQFRDYRDRGDQYRALVAALAPGGNVPAGLPPRGALGRAPGAGGRGRWI